MSPSRRSATFVVLLAFASGCTDSPGDGRKLIPVQGTNGGITYCYEDEMQVPVAEASTSSGLVPARPLPLFAANGRGDEQIRQEILAYRRDQQDRITRERQERQDAQELQDRAQSRRREQGRLEQHARFLREHDQFNQRRLERDRAAREQAARQQSQDEAQARVVQRQLDLQFQQQQLEQLRQSGMLSRQR